MEKTRQPSRKPNPPIWWLAISEQLKALFPKLITEAQTAWP